MMRESSIKVLLIIALFSGTHAQAQKVKPEDKNKVFYGGYKYKDPKVIVDERPVLSDVTRAEAKSQKRINVAHNKKKKCKNSASKKSVKQGGN